MSDFSGLSTLDRCRKCSKYIDGRTGTSFGGQPCVYTEGSDRPWCTPYNFAVIPQSKVKIIYSCPRTCGGAYYLSIFVTFRAEFFCFSLCECPTHHNSLSLSLSLSLSPLYIHTHTHTHYTQAPFPNSLDPQRTNWLPDQMRYERRRRPKRRSSVL